jgi:ABC-type multidrug transport system permease subunit
MGGMTSRTPRLAAERIGLLAGYSVLGGIGGTLIVHTIMGFLGGNWWLQALIGTMVVFSVSIFANGLQSVLGLIGTGVVIGLFVILGNPSGAGPWPREMMPGFWRTIGPWLPNFQGTNAVRGVAYFGSNGLGTALWVLAAYAAIGIVLSLAFAGRDNPVLRLSEH